MDPSPQLQSYIQNSRASGLPEDVIRNELLRSGWPPEAVNQALQPMATQNTVDSHKVRNGVLWILSPFILLFGIIILQIIVHLLLNNSSAGGSIVRAVNIISILCGIVGIILIPVGPIVGIIKLTRH